MRIAIAGTPGTGKTHVCHVLLQRGHRVVQAEEESERLGLLGPEDPRTGAREVDAEALGRVLPRGPEPLFVGGHWAHLLDCDLSVVLRCHPEVLRGRLRERGWPEAKIQENVEAEALDVILVEASEEGDTYEVDTTSRTPQETARAVEEILQGRGEGHRPGGVDWSEVILTWY